MRRTIVTALLLGLTLSSAASVAGAQEQAKTPAESSDTSPRYVPPSAAKSVEIGDFYLKRKKFKAALSRFHEALTTDPHYARAYLDQGKAYERIGQRQQALDSYRRYLDELPSAEDAKQAKHVHKAIARLEKESHPQH